MFFFCILLISVQLADLKALAERHRNAAVNSQDEVRKLRSTVDDLTSEITTIRAQVSLLLDKKGTLSN